MKIIKWREFGRHRRSQIEGRSEIFIEKRNPSGQPMSRSQVKKALPIHQFIRCRQLCIRLSWRNENKHQDQNVKYMA